MPHPLSEGAPKDRVRGRRVSREASEGVRRTGGRGEQARKKKALKRLQASGVLCVPERGGAGHEASAGKDRKRRERSAGEGAEGGEKWGARGRDACCGEQLRRSAGAIGVSRGILSSGMERRAMARDPEVASLRGGAAEGSGPAIS